MDATKEMTEIIGLAVRKTLAKTRNRARTDQCVARLDSHSHLAARGLHDRPPYAVAPSVSLEATTTAELNK